MGAGGGVAQRMFETRRVIQHFGSGARSKLLTCLPWHSWPSEPCPTRLVILGARRPPPTSPDPTSNKRKKESCQPHVEAVRVQQLAFNKTSSY